MGGMRRILQADSSICTKHDSATMLWPMSTDDWIVIGAIAAVVAVIFIPLGWWIYRRKASSQKQTQEQSTGGARQYQEQVGGGTQKQKQTLEGP